jgi:hypothetical protein
MNMTRKIVTDPTELLAGLELAMHYVRQARDLLLPLRLPAGECCYLTTTLDQLRALRAAAWEARHLPPDPEGMNDRRATWAAQALATFMAATGTDREDAVADLLADLIHWCDRNAQEFGRELARAEAHYAAETSDDQSTE